MSELTWFMDFAMVMYGMRNYPSRMPILISGVLLWIQNRKMQVSWLIISGRNNCYISRRRLENYFSEIVQMQVRRNYSEIGLFCYHVCYLWIHLCGRRIIILSIPSDTLNCKFSWWKQFRLLIFLSNWDNPMK